MDKEMLKGLAMCAVVLAALAGLFIAVSASGPDQAKCIASAVKSGVAYGNIAKTCKLGGQ